MTEGLLRSPLVTIVVNNYNYGRFLPEAIDSALEQTYSDIEVIVVDDGSTDNSREIIESYEGRIIPLLKRNGGQASACNAGLTASKGEIVIFLDADDILLPDTVRLVVTAFQTEPNVIRVQYRMQVIDANSKPTGELRPPRHIDMPSGDLRQIILNSHTYWAQSTSGNAFLSTVLRQIYPIPETLYRTMVDIYLSNLTPAFGSVISLDEVGGLYRVHGNNNYSSSMPKINVALVRKEIQLTAYAHARQRDLFNSLYCAGTREMGSRDLHTLSLQAISLKLDPLNHPFKESLLRLCARGCILTLTHPYPGLYRWFQRPLHALWFAAMLMSPQHLAKPLAEMFLYREKRGRLVNGLIAFLRKAV